MSLRQIPHRGDNDKEREIISHINSIVLGNTNNTDTVTLTENASSTVVNNSRISSESYIEFMPTTANAASEKSGGAMYVSAQENGQFTIAHANNAQTDRTFRYVHVG